GVGHVQVELESDFGTGFDRRLRLRRSRGACNRRGCQQQTRHVWKVSPQRHLLSLFFSSAFSSGDGPHRLTTLTQIRINGRRPRSHPWAGCILEVPSTRDLPRRGTEVVVTGAPRKRLVRKGTWVRIPPSPPISPTARLAGACGLQASTDSLRSSFSAR